MPVLLLSHACATEHLSPCKNSAVAFCIPTSFPGHISLPHMAPVPLATWWLLPGHMWAIARRVQPQADMTQLPQPVNR